jgi:hypothetical protein
VSSSGQLLPVALWLPASCLLPAAFSLLLFAASEARAESSPRAVSPDLVGHGQTKADAEQDALEQARTWVIALLREYHPGLLWEPTSAYLREWHLVREVTYNPAYASQRVGRLHQVTLRVELGDDSLREMLRQDRLYQRHLLTGKVLAGLMGLLVILAVYFRLEEITRGYYSGALRACLSGGLILLGVGMWFLW